MTEPPPQPKREAPGKPAGPPKTSSQAKISSQDLLAGRREVIIQHGPEQYRLQLTNSNKLILVK